MCGAEVVRVLAERGADIDKAINHGTTPLLIASGKGRVEVVRLLVEERADINKAQNLGLARIVMASREGRLDSTHTRSRGSAPRLTVVRIEERGR